MGYVSLVCMDGLALQVSLGNGTRIKREMSELPKLEPGSHRTLY